MKRKYKFYLGKCSDGSYELLLATKPPVYTSWHGNFNDTARNIGWIGRLSGASLVKKAKDLKIGQSIEVNISGIGEIFSKRKLRYGS